MTNIFSQAIRKFKIGHIYLNDSFNKSTQIKSNKEKSKNPSRTEVINFLLGFIGNDKTNYLEIGVRNPNDNFNKIISKIKYSVDPGVEFKSNPVDFKLTSDDFFKQLREGKILDRQIKFDVIFIDGLHLADQVERDILNSLDFITDDGFIILHDCNPPTEFHSRESYNYFLSPATYDWNGTTWKAFFKYRQENQYYSCCVDTDWGIGIISKKVNIGKSSSIKNPFYEFNILDDNRKESLNLISFEELKQSITKLV